MKPCFFRKAAYRLPATKRLVWCIVLAENQGLSLIYVRKPDDKWEHEIVVAIENVKERCFEQANVSRFPVEQCDLASIGEKLSALGDDAAEDEFDKWLKSEGLW